FIADNTAGFTCGNVGRCQLLSIVSQKDMHLFKAQFILKVFIYLNFFTVPLGRSFFFSPLSLPLPIQSPFFPLFYYFL
ncbi:hypothetical protein ACOJTA_12860, partial [Malaciobacter sp. WC5094]